MSLDLDLPEEIDIVCRSAIKNSLLKVFLSPNGTGEIHYRDVQAAFLQ